jgi:hypothetical protein
MSRCKTVLSPVAGVLILITSLLAPSYAMAQGTEQRRSEALPGAQLPASERVVDLAWPDAHTLCLLVATNEGYAVRDLDIRSGEFRVVNVPPSFRRLRQGMDLKFRMAEDGSGLAILQVPSAPLHPGELSIFTRAGDKLLGVELRGIPANFWVAEMAWGKPGELYLAARPYLNPEQPYSVGRFETATGRFDGVVLKGNLDLVDQLTILPRRDQLILRCGGIRGEYPSEPVVALWNLNKPDSILLHSRARHLQISQLDSRQAIIQSIAPGMPDPERWILAGDQTQLRRLERGMAAQSLKLRLTENNQWLVVLIPGRELSSQLKADGHYVAMQNLSTGKTLATAVECENFAVSPDSSVIAAVGKGGNQVFYYNLPQQASD